MHFTFHGIAVLVCVLLGLGGVFWVSVMLLMAWMLLHPPRMSAGKAIYHLRRLSPGDLGLNFEEMSFLARDSRSGKKLFIAGWWIPSKTSSERCVLMLHGYADAKVGAIAWAPVFHEMGLNVTAIDLRAHGNSDGRLSTGGYFEREDVTQVIDQLLMNFPNQTRKLFIFGASLGAAVACGVAAGRADIAGIILESPFADYEKAVAAHLRLMGLPGGMLLRAALNCAQWISGAKFSEVRPVEVLAKLPCPVLTILGTEDELLDQQDIERLRQATMLHAQSDVWLVEGAGHLQAIAVAPEEYARRIGVFVESTIKQGPPDRG